ncbi:MAG: beta-ketoacyl-[acyl-carrier-protein] synthase family protein [Vicinamibacteria bacterium]|jgi:3-oxoacyl-[acyl-carrier-protein] synthase II|nr:beta-ketoacyl-[acyl-carrier-protein] synthase family protein [Vicinamibacteria bacterium]
MTTRVFVTGLGPVCALGQKRETFWANLLAGRSSVDRLARLDGAPIEIGAETGPFEAESALNPRERRYDRATQLTLVAARVALEDAQLLRAGQALALDANRAGVVIGSSRGPAELLEHHLKNYFARGLPAVGPSVSPLTTLSNLSATVARRFVLRGPNLAVSSACSSGTQAIGTAFEMVRSARADVMLAGGAEACLTPFCMAMFDAAGILSRQIAAPRAAARPFDRDRDGIVLGDGAGLLVLESEAHARARGARLTCEICGFGSTCDAHSLTGMPEDGEGLIRAIEGALADAGHDARDVQHINAHGTGTVLGDRIETLAYKKAFGSHARALAISATKSTTGHLLGAAGGIEAIACALALAENIVPPTINLDHPDPDCDLDYVPHQARRMDVRAALSVSMGFGGNNACLVFKRA